MKDVNTDNQDAFNITIAHVEEPTFFFLKREILLIYNKTLYLNTEIKVLKILKNDTTSRLITRINGLLICDLNLILGLCSI